MNKLEKAREPEEEALCLAKQWFNNKEIPSLVNTLARDIQSYAESYHAKKCDGCTRVVFNNLGPKKFDV